MIITPHPFVSRVRRNLKGKCGKSEKYFNLTDYIHNKIMPSCLSYLKIKLQQIT